MTPRVAIEQALKKIGVLGVGQTAEAEDYNDAFLELQNMLFQWQQERWLVYALMDVALTSNGAKSYTVGLGGDFNVLRPDNIESAYFINLNMQGEQPVSYPLEIIKSYEDYSRLTLKSLVTWPQYAFYDSAYPLGNLFVNPIPAAAQYEIHLVIKTPLPAPNDGGTEMSTPPEYNQAIIYNLACLLATSYGVAVPPDVRVAASTALNTIRLANTQISTLQMPKSVSGRGGVYNPFSDRVN